VGPSSGQPRGAAVRGARAEVCGISSRAAPRAKRQRSPSLARIAAPTRIDDATPTSPSSTDLTTAVSGRRPAGALVLGPGVEAGKRVASIASNNGSSRGLAGGGVSLVVAAARRLCLVLFLQRHVRLPVVTRNAVPGRRSRRLSGCAAVPSSRCSEHRDVALTSCSSRRSGATGWLPWFPALLRPLRLPASSHAPRSKGGDSLPHPMASNRATECTILRVARTSGAAPTRRGGGGRGTARGQPASRGRTCRCGAVCDIAHAQHLRTGTVLGEFW